MPIVTSEEPLGFTAYLPQKPEQVSPESLDVWSAAMQTENSFGSFVSAMQDKEDYPAVEGYDVLDDLTGYEEYVDDFLESYSPQKTAEIKRHIDRQKENRQILADSGAEGIVAQMVAGISDPAYIPAMFLGLAEARAAKTAAQGFTKAALSGAGAEVTPELIKQKTQDTRTLGEGAAIITGSALLSGLIGGGLNAMTKREFDEISTAIDVELGNVPRSAGAAQTRDFTKADLELVGAGGLEKLGVSPQMRLMNSDSIEARKAIQGLGETSPIVKAAERGVTVVPEGGAVETRIKLWDAGRYEAKKGRMDLYKKYRARVKSLGQTPLTKAQFGEEIGKAMRRNDTSVIPEVEQGAKLYRAKVIEPMKEAAINERLLPEDVDVSTADSYLMRLYNTRKIIAKRDEWDKILTDWFGRMRAKADQEFITRERAGKNIPDSLRAQAKMTDADIKEAIDSITNNILGTPSGKIPYNVKVTVRGPLKERVLNIPDRQIEEFLESDIDIVTDQYVRTMAPDIEITRMFGDVDMTATKQSIVDEYDELIKKAKTEKQRTALQKRMDADLRDLEAMRDRLRGQYAIPKDPDSFFIRAPRVLRSLNFLRMLGGMTLSAIPDLGRIFATNGARSVGRGLKAMVTDMGKLKLAVEEARKAAVGMEMVLNTKATGVMADVFEPYGKHTKFERGLDAMGDAFGKISLMAQWNATMKQFSGVLVQDRILSEALNWTNGTIKPAMKKRLAQVGIDKDMAERITQQFKAHGDDGELKLSGGENWDDAGALQTLRAAVLKDVDRSIVTVGQGETPLFMSTELGKLIMQFKSFALAAHQKVLVAGLQYRDAQELNGALISIALGASVYAMKQKISDKEIDTDPVNLVREGIDRSGVLGFGGDVNNITEKLTDGRIGTSAILGGKQASRYATRGEMGALLGPSFGTAEDVIDITGAAFRGEIEEKEIGQMRRLLPFQNLFYMRWLFNKLEAAGADLEI